MKPDAWMPVYGNDFLQAVEGLPDAIAFGYFRLCWYYWHHNHCAGLKDDDEFLRKIARIERDEWPEAKATLFDNDKFFTNGADEFWHQKRCDEEWQKAVKNYESTVERAKLGAKQRWKGHKRK